jgi:hypothetical protein
MKRILYLFPLLFAGLFLSELEGQDVSYEDIGFGVELYPHLSNRRLLAGNSVTFAEVARIDSLEKADFGYGLGIFYAQRVERLGFHFGLRYLVTGYQTNNDEVPGQNPNVQAVLFNQTYRAQLLEVPFQLNFYQNFGENTSFYFTLGAAASLHLNSRVNETTIVPNGPTTTEELITDVEYRNLNFAMIAAMGVERRFNKFTLGLQPTFEYWLGGNVLPRDDSELSRNLYNVGLRLTGQFSTY